MAGLLDFGGGQGSGGLLGDLFNDPGARLGLGLLAASSPRLRGLGQVMEQQDQEKQQALRSQYIQSQIAENTAQTKTREQQTLKAQRDQAAEQRRQQILPTLFGQGGAPGGVGDFNVQAAIAENMTPEEITKYAALPNLGRQEVARTIETTDAQGRPITVQTDKFGNRIGEGMGQWKEPMVINQGDRQTLLDPASRQAVGSFGINMSQSERDASARGWAGNALAKQRMEFDMGGGADVGPSQAGFVKQFGKPPAGYRWKPDGALEAIPGGPTDIKAGEAGAKAEQRKLAAAGSVNNVLSAVSDAKDLVGVNTTGLGSSLAKIPGTDARDLSSKLETVKANLGFDRLQQMRDMSPTGGALGAVAVQELTALQATVASLDQGQSRAELTKSLNKIETHYNNWLKTVNGETPKAPPKPGDLGSGSFPPPNVSMRWNPNTRKLEKVN